MLLHFDIERNIHSFHQVKEPHSHGEYEILLCLSDGGRFYIQDNVLPLCHNAMFILPPNVLHRCIVDIAEYERYVLHFSADALWTLSSAQTDFLKIFKNTIHNYVLPDEDFERILALMSRCSEESTVFGGDLQRDIAFMQLILEISRILRDKEHLYAPHPSKEFSRIMPLIEYIHSHYSEDITLDVLSREFYMSKYYICHLFKELTGFSVGAYLINFRIRQACILLRNGTSVQEAGEQVGFKNNSHFIRSFGRTMGISPSKYVKSV